MSTKKAYDYGVLQALLQLRLVKVALTLDTPKKEGKETRLKRDHNPTDFFSVKRTFERAAPQKKEVGVHLDLKKEQEPS
jgi:hypothetical protein